MIEYSAIPTVYNFVQYRSRLEARVAAFLDLHNYHHDFEPLDLKKYIPDFIVDLPFGPCLLECKPAVTPREFKPACKKITKSGWEGPALVIGSRLTEGVDTHTDLTLYGTTHAELGRWTQVGRDCWPKAWGAYPFELIYQRWHEAGALVQWASPRDDRP